MTPLERLLGEALKWALPLAKRCMEDHRCMRIENGHHDIGNKVVGLWDKEVEDIEKAEAAMDEFSRQLALEQPKAPY